MVIVAACNPYKFKKKNHTSAGLKYKNINQLELLNTQDLVYKVYPFP